MAKAKHCFIAISTDELDDKVMEWVGDRIDTVSHEANWFGYTMVWLTTDIDVVEFRLTFPEMEYNR